ncbi:MAG: GNAT family N-acetyltransferase [Alphaproteobacteria bacterium]|nr:GNAT family N-acetyltransferase [Alphaproteobacteria bacterium]
MNNIAQFKVNNQGFWSGLLSKKSGKEIAPSPFFIYPLSKKHASQMAALSKEIYRHLKKEEQCYIHQHQADYYQNIFHQKDITFIGVFHQDKLIAMSYLRTCRSQEVFQEEIPCFQGQTFLKQEEVATLGGDCVHPEFRGNNLNQLMVEFRLEMAKEKKCEAAYSIIDQHNHWNIGPYFKNGFKMVSYGIDPSDGGKIAIMRFRNEKIQRIGNMILVPVQDIKTINRLMSCDFIGSSYDTQTRKIMFTRPAEPQHIKSDHILRKIRRLREKIMERQYV